MTRKLGHSKQEYQDAVLQSLSLADVARRLGIIPAGGNYQTMKRNIEKYDIDYSHFTEPWESGLYSNNYRSLKKLRETLISTRGHKCEKCGFSEWFDVPIKLEVEHIDGNSGNDSENNIMLLCPNCHAQTPTWRRSKKLLIGKNNAFN